MGAEYCTVYSLAFYKPMNMHDLYLQREEPVKCGRNICKL
jgi:hypothetical protein